MHATPFLGCIFSQKSPSYIQLPSATSSFQIIGSSTGWFEVRCLAQWHPSRNPTILKTFLYESQSHAFNLQTPAAPTSI